MSEILLELEAQGAELYQAEHGSLSGFEQFWSGQRTQALIDARKIQKGEKEPPVKKESVSTSKNPWSKEHWNVTAQMQVVAKEGKAKARQLCEAAGYPVPLGLEG